MAKLDPLNGWKPGPGAPLLLIAGPCVIESEKLCMEIGERLAEISSELEIPLIFKASYDKANRTSVRSFRGPGIKSGLKVLYKVRQQFGLRILTDVHSLDDIQMASDVVDVLQIPAFLCRQTDLLLAAGRSGCAVNVKKGQFLAPFDMQHVVQKLTSARCRKIFLTERGTSFGYHNLVADMRSIPIMKSFGHPVIFDATHSVQLPGGAGEKSDGQGELAPVLARAAVAAGCDGVFIETHPEPSRALSDGPNMVPLKNLPRLLKLLIEIRRVVQG